MKMRRWLLGAAAAGAMSCLTGTIAVSALEAQCWMCEVRVNSQWEIVDADCVPDDGGRATCEIRCRFGRCTCNNRGTCGVSWERLRGDGTVFVRMGAEAGNGSVRRHKVGAVIRGGCNGAIIGRRYHADGAQRIRAGVRAIML